MKGLFTEEEREIKVRYFKTLVKYTDKQDFRLAQLKAAGRPEKEIEAAKSEWMRSKEERIKLRDLLNQDYKQKRS